jgi:hypothetical protein
MENKNEPAAIFLARKRQKANFVVKNPQNRNVVSLLHYCYIISIDTLRGLCNFICHQVGDNRVISGQILSIFKWFGPFLRAVF